jgi:hypothetical protein
MNDTIDKNKTNKINLKFSAAITPKADEEELLFIRQLGLDHVYTWVPDNQMDYDSLREI